MLEKEAMKRKEEATVSDFDLADHIQDDGDLAAILSDAFASRDDKLLTHGLRLALRVKGMARLAEASGLTKEEVRNALTEGQNPRLQSVLAILAALGFELHAAPLGSFEKLEKEQTVEVVSS